MSSITTILMPMRDANIGAVVGGIRGQTIHSEIWVWDTFGKFRGIGEDIYFSCSYNWSHRPRFLLSGLVKTEFIFIQDDDWCIVDNKLFENLVALSRSRPDHFIGHRGKTFGDYSHKEKPYQHSTGWCGEGECQTVNTGLSFFPTRLINHMPCNPTQNGLNDEEYQYGDDMYISKYQKCYASMLFQNGMRPLDEQGVGVSHHPQHMDVRNRLCLRFWGHLIK